MDEQMLEALKAVFYGCNLGHSNWQAGIGWEHKVRKALVAATGQQHWDPTDEEVAAFYMRAPSEPPERKPWADLPESHRAFWRRQYARKDMP